MLTQSQYIVVEEVDVRVGGAGIGIEYIGMEGDVVVEIALHGDACMPSKERLAVEGCIGEAQPVAVVSKAETEVEGGVFAAVLGSHFAGGKLSQLVCCAEGECGQVVGDKAETFVVYQVGIVFGFVVGRLETGGDGKGGHTLTGEGLSVCGGEYGVLETLGVYLDGDAKGFGIGKLVAVE